MTNMSIGELLYCLEQDIEEYSQHHNLENDEEFNSIISQINEITEKFNNG